VQTFLPYADFEESASVLDWRRLGKQRVEASQILNALADPSYGWQNHPAVRMWRGHEAALRRYRNAMIREWVRRGYQNNMPLTRAGGTPKMPPWLGCRRFHDSHRSNLLRKDPAHYTQLGWGISPNLPYLWPSVESGTLLFKVGEPPPRERTRTR
jgi:hypothetical protein